MSPSQVGPVDRGEVDGVQDNSAAQTRLWPVYLADAMQQDAPMLFEVGDVVTWPMRLVDTSGPDSGWPEGVAVTTPVRLEAGLYPGGRGRLAVTPEFSVCWSGDEPVGTELQLTAALVADFFNPPFTTHITGLVRQITIASCPYKWSQRGRHGAWYPDGTWDLQSVRVAPLGFVHDLEAPGARREHGLLIRLELMTPRCRCQEIKQISGERAWDYARRHLREVGGDRPRGTIDYVCPVTKLGWRLDHPELPAGWRPARLRRCDTSATPS